ncbi:MAG: HAMP domain-containing histidine kinase [Myxococcales bacterium]|nr:HAMP domain-containing histidine kinase [Myxococcales bacterium]
MKLVAKFALAFFLAATVCLFFSSWFSARRAVARVDASAEADLRGLATGLREGLRSVWASQGRAAAMEFLRAAHTGEVDLAWSASKDLRPPVVIEDVARGRRISLSLPMRVADEEGVLTLSRALPDARTVMKEELRAELFTTLSLAVVGVALAVALGGVLIGSPLARVARQAQRIGAGDLSQRLRSDRKDELGDLKRALNVMCDRLAEARERVEREEAARLETLERMRHLDRLGTVGTIASSIAHELGTPLNVVLIRAQSLTGADLVPSEVRDAGLTIGRQVEKMSAIVRQLLGLARRETTPRAPIRLSEVAVEVQDLLAGLAKKNRTQLVVQGDADPQVLADRGQLVQVATNLVVNAVHAMPEGGVIILRVAQGLVVPPRGGPAMLMASLAVLDQGSGMTPDLVAQIFEPFFTTKPHGRGTGLGLAVARGIVEDHNGFLEVTSLEGRGSTFELHLPLVE